MANLGAIGSIIAHEITHGYDDQGRKFDEIGNLNNWWNDEDVTSFNAKCDRVKEIAGKYQFVDGNDVHNINADLTMGENLADINGLSVSIKVMNNYLMNGDHRNDETYIRNCHRIFFISWGNAWKQNIKKERQIMLLNADPHAPADFRCNLIKNFDIFHKAFDISKDSPMYLPEDQRVNMW